MNGEEARDRERKFRRPSFEPADAEEAAKEEPGSSVPVPLPTEELRIALKPLRDLAEAFRENSETLRALAEGQSRLAKRIDRTDRSEAVIQSTQALNDTFRGVQRTQERLMNSMEGEKRRPWILLGGVVAILAVFVGGVLWMVFSWLDEKEADGRARDGETVQSIVSGDLDRIEDLHEQLSLQKVRIAELAKDMGERESAISDLQERIAEKEKEIRGLRESQDSVSRTLRENATLSSEVARLSGELTAARRDLGESRLTVGELEDDIRQMEAKLAALARSAVASSTAPPPGRSALPPGVSPEPGERPAIPVEAATDPQQLGRIVSVLNGLLLDKDAGESYRFRSIGGARGKVLYEVAVVHLDESGKEAKRIEAAELRIMLDDEQSRAELRFLNGHISYYGVKAPFWGGRYVVPLVDLDLAAWRRSGLTIFSEVR